MLAIDNVAEDERIRDLYERMLKQFNVTIQREIMSGSSLMVSYVGSRGNHVGSVRSVNIKKATILGDGTQCFNYTASGGNPSCPNGATTLRNIKLNGDSRALYDAQSFYNSLQLGLNQRLKQGLQLALSYSYSKLIDDGVDRFDSTGSPGSSDPATQDPDNPKDKRGLSILDLRHNLVINFLYEIPTPGFENRIAKGLFGGWQANGIMRRTSGKPFSAAVGFGSNAGLNDTGNTRPNLKPGRSNNPVLGGPDKYFDPTAFEVQTRGFFGNAGAFTLIGPGSVSLDLGLVKELPLGEQRRLQFRTEFFDLLNHPNFVRPNATIQTSRTAVYPNPQAGRIADTVNTARQIQFALKVEF